MRYQAEYIWIDGTEPTPLIRCKTKIVADGAEPPIWGFDGSSTNQALGHDVGLRPPARLRAARTRCAADNNVSCSAKWSSPTSRRIRRTRGRRARRWPSATPTRSRCSASSRSTPSSRTVARSAGRRSATRLPRARTTAASAATTWSGARSSSGTPPPAWTAGIGIEGTNAEVMKGQWEFQIGILAATDDRRPSLGRAVAVEPHRRGLRGPGELRAASRSPATGTAPARTPTSRPRRCAKRLRRRSSPAAEALGKRVDEHIDVYGADIKSRLTGAHETAHWNEYSYGVSNRGASVRIPWQVDKDQEGLPRGSSAERQHGPLPGDRRAGGDCLWRGRRELTTRATPPRPGPVGGDRRQRRSPSPGSLGGCLRARSDACGDAVVDWHDRQLRE